MPSVIDALILEISLDPKQFHEGQRALDSELDKTKRSLTSFGREIETGGQKIADVFSVAKRGVVGLLAAFVGGEAAAFIERVANMDAHTGRLARSIGESTHELSVWQNMIRSVGGTAQDVSSTFGGLNDMFENMKMANAMPSAGFASLLGRSGVDWRSSTESGALEQIMRFLAPQAPREQRFWLQQIPGMNESMMMLMMQIMKDPDKMKHLREEIEKIGVASDASAAAAQDLQQKTGEMETAWESLARVMFPILTTIMEWATRLLSLPGIGKVLGGAAAGAVAGSVVPGVGTIAGGLIGATAGAIYGMSTGNAGTRGDRNNNPGNIKYGQWAAAHGATGADSGDFAIFPSSHAGEAAMAQLLHDRYQGLTLAQIQERWVGNKDTGYLGQMTKSTGLGAGGVPNLNDPEMVAALMRGMMTGEGTHHMRGATPGASTKTSSVNIGSINVTTSKADPAAVADQIPDAMKRYTMLGGINSGLV